MQIKIYLYPGGIIVVLEDLEVKYSYDLKPRAATLIGYLKY